MSQVLDGSAPAPVLGITISGPGGVETEIAFDQMGDVETAEVLPTLLREYGAPCNDWTTLAGEHWRQGRMDRAEELIREGIKFFGGAGRGMDHQALVYLHNMLAHFLLAQSRSAPKMSLTNAKYDKLGQVKTKEAFYTEAAASLNRSEQAWQSLGGYQLDEPVALLLGKIILCLARGEPQNAQPMVNRLLERQPNNLIALTAQARLQFARRAHDAALQTYQKLLGLAPDMSPDPRIGLGLCAYVLGDKQTAEAAWNRALQRDPAAWVPSLLLGLSSLNQAREPSTPRETRLKLEAEGVASVQRAFKLNNKSSAAALALASISGQGGQLPLASKLAERAIQFADNKRHSILANSERGRLGFVAGDVGDAAPFIAAAKAEEGAAGVNVIAELTLGQIAIKSGNLREALNFIEQSAKRLNGKGPLEFTVLHACLLAFAHPGMKEDEIARNRATARTMLTDLHELVATAESEEDWAKLRGIGEDADVFIDLGRMWQDESLEKAIGSYQTAVSMTANEEDGEGGKVDQRNVRLSSNLGTLFQLQGNIETAERMYQEALSKIAQEEGKEAEVVKTILAYNLGRAYEDEGDVQKATQWYRDVLRQHPEHMESKVRLAAISSAAGRNLDAHNLLKECLKADENNISLRTVYTHFLISIGSYKEALAFTTATLKLDRSDPATFCALGWLHFALGREAKSNQEVANRSKEYLRSAEAYQRALDLDPRSAVAAQGLAIALAEDTLSLATGQPGSVDELKTRARLAGQALTVFGRIADSLPSGAVNVNIGHCHFARGEEEKAIQSYEAASRTFKGKNVSVLLYLARAWYAYANRDTNFSAMTRALNYCQQAMHVQPSDRAILYNIAMILQKGAELLLGLEPSKRTLEELKTAVEQAQQAANIFRTLADDRSGALPYDADLADQRARYGDGLLRRAPEQLERQQTYEHEAAARVEEARRIREAEKVKLQEAEARRTRELEEKAREIEEKRRLAREEAHKWQLEMNQREQEEAERKAQAAEKRKKRKEEGVIESGDEGREAGGSQSRAKKPKKKKAPTGKKGRKVRSKSEIESESEASLGEDEDEAMGSAGEQEEEEDPEVRQAREAKKALETLRRKAKAKRARRADPDDLDEDDEEVGGGGGGGRRGKQFKSKAVIEDSDEDADDADGAGAGAGDEAKASSPPLSDAASPPPPEEGTTEVVGSGEKMDVDEDEEE